MEEIEKIEKITKLLLKKGGERKKSFGFFLKKKLKT